MSSLTKIVYYDLDGTLCHRLQSVPSLPFEKVPTEDGTFRDMTNIFSHSYISKLTLSYLQRMKQLGIIIVGVTARDRHTGTKLQDNVLRLFDRIYCGSNNVCYDVKQNCFLDEHFKTFYTDYAEEINRNLIKVQEIMKDLGINADYCPKDTIDTFIYVRLSECGNRLNEFISRCRVAGFVPIIFKSHGVLELKLADISKSEAVAFDRQFYEKSYAICVGDSVTDFEMLSSSDLGIFPKSLITKLEETSPFTLIGSNVGKIVAIEDENFIRDNPREVIASFTKVDKNYA